MKRTKQLSGIALAILSLSISLSTEAINSYHAFNPGLVQWQDSVNPSNNASSAAVSNYHHQGYSFVASPSKEIAVQDAKNNQDFDLWVMLRASNGSSAYK